MKISLCLSDAGTITAKRGRFQLLLAVISLFLLNACAGEAIPTLMPPAFVFPPTVTPAPTPESYTAGVWELRTSMLVPRSETGAVMFKERLYVPGGFGGEATFEVYDPVADSWHLLAGLPVGRHHAMVTADDENIYFLGGSQAGDQKPTNSAWSYNPLTDVWTRLPDMPEPRMAGAALFWEEQLYVMGGVGGSTDLFRYDTDTNLWQSLPGPEQPREHLAAVIWRQEIYVLGGRWTGAGELESVEIYDPATALWRPGPALTEPRAGFAAVVLNDRIVIAGGELIFSDRRTLDSVEQLHPIHFEWQPLPPLPIPLHGLAMIGFNHELYVLGGSDRAGGIDNHGRVLVYQP